MYIISTPSGAKVAQCHSLQGFFDWYFRGQNDRFFIECADGSLDPVSDHTFKKAMSSDKKVRLVSKDDLVTIKLIVTEGELS